MKLTPAEINIAIAEKVMEWHSRGALAVSSYRKRIWITEQRIACSDLPDFYADPVASKMLRAHLGQRWDWSHGHSSHEAMRFTDLFVLWDRDTGKPSHEARTFTEESAVALCALKSVGLEVEVV